MSAEQIDLIEGAGYVWTNMTQAPAVATLTVATAGVHVVNVWMGEDGFIFDKIVLTLDSSYVATGTGPANSVSASDTDLDGMTDVAEALAGFDPGNGDQNGNGVLDGLEDWDNDLVSNALEVALGTAAGSVPAPAVPAGKDDDDGCGLMGLEPLLLLALLRRFRRRTR